MHEGLSSPEFGADKVLGVSALNRLARQTIEQAIPLLWVAGEVSNLTHAASGHLYFSLKDQAAQVRCVMFRNRAQLLAFRLASGMQVEVRALATLYEARGEFQLNVETVRRAGIGALYEAFARLRERLSAEGLFDASHKRTPPRYPESIGILTSPQAAALRDVLAALGRRSPHVPVILYPAPVQGEGAAALIAQRLIEAGQRNECDVLLLVRGGGSIEDLWAFNEEVVARAIRACLLPVVCGVGHETDVTIADLAADQRAATPTAAAELVSAGYFEAVAQLRRLDLQLQRATQRLLEARMQRLDLLVHRLVHPGERIARYGLHASHLHLRLTAAVLRAEEGAAQRLSHAETRLSIWRPDLASYREHIAHLRQRLGNAMKVAIEQRHGKIKAIAANLAHLNPQEVLQRGYSIARDGHGRVVRSSAQIDIGDKLELEFGSGSAAVDVRNKQ